MIITKTPFRISFFGGGTDFYDFYKKNGGAVISTTFNKYCYVTLRKLPAFFEYKNLLTYSKNEEVKSIDEIEHPAIREAMKRAEVDNIRLIYDADLPARSGLGSSSSFAVGMFNAFYAMKGKVTSKRQLANEAIILERELCNEKGGIQDQIAAAFGGLNRIDFNEDGYTVKPIIISKDRKKNLENNLMLFFTGFSRFSSEIQAPMEKALEEKEDRLKKMLKLVDDAEDILTNENRNLDEFGELLDYTWKLKRGITDKISNNAIDDLYDKAITAGAIGGKLLGAGGGGFLLFYVTPEKQENVKKALEDLLYVPFEFENEGASIVYYSPEE